MRVRLPMQVADAEVVTGTDEIAEPAGVHMGSGCFLCRYQPTR